MFHATTPAGHAVAVPGRRETVVLLAGLMALNAFAIDAMIPALPAIGAELGVAEDNRRQLVVVSYMLGFGVGQIIWGPLADRFGRKPILAIGVALYSGFALLCGVASSFELLIAGRVAMGASAAVTRVLLDQFGLTSAEAAVSAMLCAGTNLRDIAQARGAAVATVRNQVKSVMGKAGVRRQSELVARLLAYL